MQYEFKNRMVAKIPEKLIIVAKNPLICYLIVMVDYANPFLVNKLIILSIKIKVSRKTSFANDSLVKPRRQTRPD